MDDKSSDKKKDALREVLNAWTPGTWGTSAAKESTRTQEMSIYIRSGLCELVGDPATPPESPESPKSPVASLIPYLSNSRVSFDPSVAASM